LRKEESRLGYPEDVVAFRSKEIRLNIEYTYRLENTKEFGNIDAEGVGGGKTFAYPFYLFCRPKAIMGRKIVNQRENVDAILSESEIFQGNTKQTSRDELNDGKSFKRR
jgi:hypothetical protein